MPNWTQYEDKIIIADYFQMLDAELRGIPYNKTDHRRKLLKQLNNRSESSIEFKHCNISAVLIKFGMPYIKGYQPRFNYQNLLEEEVLDVFNGRRGMTKVFNDFATKKVTEKRRTVHFENWGVEAPGKKERKSIKSPRSFTPIKKNYLEIEQRNQSIGTLGEKLVYDYEIWRLYKAELPKLAKQVEWVSKEQGDGAGYDILSKDLKGKDMYIEVKTTTLGKESPIFFSITEYEFSKDRDKQFFLYRVFDVKDNPKFFTKNGKLNDICSQVESINFKGYF